ncbi:putative AraC family transcriptional regulator [Microlunatus phosphovorus NM-1]|uniref:Putative AraC family transcriptional regulator n=1 Tax=Microlunatus phosphovorus (strain ATCC 700054 / DSM 10555 / JCM 9379 / NBRC 101784 / NCIMB 13414 / VKM Ac-1990 / NM-1) TaxID=1032480 RepID=F5XQY0_MICPN|nr:putative AraC family transcriptional regulator [Microlunatus phosphovorus NM-1]
MLRELRFESAAYRWLELGAPFRIGFDEPGLRGVHIVVEGGCELVTAEGSVVRLDAGDLVLLPRGDAHEIRSAERGGRLESGFDLAMRTPGTRLRAGGSGARTVVVCGAFVVREMHHPALLGLPHLIRVPGVDGRPPAWLAPYVSALATEAFEGEAGSDLVMARLSDALLVRALRHHGESGGGSGWLSGLRDPYVAVALRLLHEDPARPWTLASLARAVGLSRAAFAARFTERVGQPAMQYLLSLRMQRARSMLRDQRATVAAVATRVGYTSDVAFAAAFKREVGTTPGAYRRAAQADQ